MLTKTLNGLEAIVGYPTDLIVRHFERRMFELAMTVTMIGEALLLTFSPTSIEASSFRFMLQAMNAPMCVILFASLGLARIVALGLNGHWHPYGAYIRAGGAVVGAFMWGQMCAALLEHGAAVGAPISPGVPIYTTIALFEIISMYRALIGAKKAHGRGD